MMESLKTRTYDPSARKQEEGDFSKKGEREDPYIHMITLCIPDTPLRMLHLIGFCTPSLYTITKVVLGNEFNFSTLH